MTTYETRKARKEHICTLCNFPIRMGERYEFRRITPWDHPDNDGFFSYHAHCQCDHAWNNIAPDWDYLFPVECSDFRDEARSRFANVSFAFGPASDG